MRRRREREKREKNCPNDKRNTLNNNYYHVYINQKTSNAFLRRSGEQEVRFTFFKRCGLAASHRINLFVISYFILTFRWHRNISILFRVVTKKKMDVPYIIYYKIESMP